MTYPVPNGIYGGSSRSPEGTLDKKCVDVNGGQSEAPQALQGLCCYEEAAQKKNSEFSNRSPVPSSESNILSEKKISNCIKEIR